jgi:hypothetical protein
MYPSTFVPSNAYASSYLPFGTAANPGYLASGYFNPSFPAGHYSPYAGASSYHPYASSYGSTAYNPYAGYWPNGFSSNTGGPSYMNDLSDLPGKLLDGPVDIPALEPVSSLTPQDALSEVFTQLSFGP